MKKRKTTKRTYSKRKSNSVKKYKMNLHEKELMAVTILAVFVFAFLLAVTNTSQQNTSVTGHAADDTEFIEKLTGKKDSVIGDLFTQWEQGNLDANITKYLFFFMVAGLVFGALSFAKFPKQTTFQVLIALPIAFLATAYITPDEVFTILQSYTALGITLTFLLPFIILIFVSAMLLSNEKIKAMSLPKVILELFLWIMFGVVLIFKMISGLLQGNIEWGLNIGMLLTSGTILAVGLIIILHKKYRNGMWKIGNQIREAKEEALGTSEAAREKSRWKRAFTYEQAAEPR